MMIKCGEARGHQHGRRPARWGLVITVAGVLGIIVILVIGFWGYDRWANSVPPFQSGLPPMPSPNGFERAAALLADLPSQPSNQGAYSRWPEGSSDALRRALLPALPTLRAVRSTFRLEWRRPLPPPSSRPGSDPSWLFWPCMGYLCAESCLAQNERDYRTAIRAKLDCMELGARMSRGSSAVPFLVAVGIHEVGFAGTELLVPHLPPAAIPEALDRVRRIRQQWPLFAEALIAERALELDLYTRVAGAYQHSTPWETLRCLWWQTGSAGLRYRAVNGQVLATWLTPKRYAVSHLDHYFLNLIAESKKPYRQRRAIAIPTDAFFVHGLSAPQFAASGEAKWRRVQTELSLLETALAVQAHRLAHGSYPARLSEVSRRWLPTLPIDPWGQPIVCRLRHSCPIIYSLGPDRRDDGGRPADAFDLNESTQGDLVWGMLTRHRH